MEVLNRYSDRSRRALQRGVFSFGDHSIFLEYFIGTKWSKNRCWGRSRGGLRLCEGGGLKVKKGEVIWGLFEGRMRFSSARLLSSPV